MYYGVTWGIFSVGIWSAGNSLKTSEAKNFWLPESSCICSDAQLQRTFLSALRLMWFKDTKHSEYQTFFTGTMTELKGLKKERVRTFIFFPKSLEVLAFYLSLGFSTGWIVKFSPPSKSFEALSFLLQTISSKLRPKPGYCTASNLNFTWDTSFSLSLHSLLPVPVQTRATGTLTLFPFTLHNYLFLRISCLPATSYTPCCQSGAFWHRSILLTHKCLRWIWKFLL